MKKTDLDIIKTSWHQHKATLSEIRFEVFVKEQGVPPDLELDEHDNEAIHFLAFFKSEDKPIATARLLADGHIGRMAVLKPYRDQSVGRFLLDSVIDMARNNSYGKLFLNAQTDATGFYNKAGFIAEGEEFLDAGIPHIRMTKKL